MTEYIDRKEFGKGMKCQSVKVLGETYIRLADLTSFIHSLTAADVAPVRHGRWVPVSNTGIGATGRCTVCNKAIYGFIAYNYCPSCGAKMDLEVSDD